MSTLGVYRMDELELKRRPLASESLVLDTFVGLPLGKTKGQDIESRVIPIILQSQPPVDDFPDGGLAAWSVLFGATCAIFATLGVLNNWGVFQAYYQQVVLPDTETSTIAWIGSAQFALVFLPGLLTGRLCDLGYYRWTLFVSSLILVLATALTAECTKFWQFLLCQGFLTGLSCGMIFGGVPVVLSHWFSKRRSMALGISITGSAIGGTVISIASSHLLEGVGFKWTMRFIAAVVFFLLAIANLTLKTRLDPPKSPGPFFSWDDFQKSAFTTYVVSGAINFLGIYTFMIYCELSAIKAGISPKFAFYLVAIANASTAFGQIVAGLLSDKVGAINVAAPSTFVAAIATLAWPFAKTKASLIFIAILYGIGAGGYLALIPAPVAMMGDVREAGRRMGIAVSVISIGAGAGPPLAGAILKHTGGFKLVGLYAAACITLAFILQLSTKYRMRGTLGGKF